MRGNVRFVLLGMARLSRLAAASVYHAPIAPPRHDAQETAASAAQPRKALAVAQRLREEAEDHLTEAAHRERENDLRLTSRRQRARRRLPLHRS